MPTSSACGTRLGIGDEAPVALDVDDDGFELRSTCQLEHMLPDPGVADAVVQVGRLHQLSPPRNRERIALDLRRRSLPGGALGL